jgi:hypothetical protein
MDGTPRNDSGTVRGTDASSPFSNGSDSGDHQHRRRKDEDFKNSLSPHSTLKRDGNKRKSILIKGRYPKAKLFDGVFDGSKNKTKKKGRGVGMTGPAGVGMYGCGV